MSLTERLSKLTGAPASIVPEKPADAKLTPRLAGLQGPPAPVAATPAPREKLTSRLTGLQGGPTPVAAEPVSRPELTSRLAGMSGSPTPVSAPREQRTKLTERLTGGGPPAPVAVPRQARIPLTERLEANGVPVPVAVPREQRMKLTERLAGGGIQAPVAVPREQRTSLVERLGGLTGGGVDSLTVPRGERMSLTERLGRGSGGTAPIAVEKAPRDALTTRVAGVAEIPQPPAPAVPAKPGPGLLARMTEIQQVLQLTSPEWRTIPFGDWMPDLPDFANPGATVARNVLPVENYYGPLGALEATTDALTARALGAARGKDTSGSNFNYAGDATKLYEVRAAGITDKSKGGGYSTGSGEIWEFATFESRLIGTNWTDPVQGIDIGAAGLFADQFTSTLKPKARHIATIREFLFLGNTNDATDGDVPYRTWWGAYKDALDMDPDAQTQSDFEDRPAGGDVQRLIGGVEYGVLFQQTAITRVTYAGGETIFQFDSIDRKRGTPIPNGVVGHGRLIFFPSEEGFFVNDGTQSHPIGVNQVDKTFAKQFDLNDANLVSAAIDPLNKLYAIAFPGSGGVLKIFFYNWIDRRWSEAEVDLELLFNSTAEAFTLEGLDAVALDSAADTTLSANEASGQTEISVTSVSGFSVGDTARITLNDATIHQSKINTVGGSTITIDDSLPSAADSGKRFVRTTIDVLTPGLDSAQWRGGGLLFGAFDTAHKLAYFDGANLAATIETGETELNPGFLSKLVKARPLIDGGTITAAVAGRNRLIDAVVFDASEALDAIGEVGMLNESRYHRLRAKIAAGGTWQHAQGIQVQASSMGTR